MNEVEANRQLKELAAERSNAKLDAQDYRRQRRLILAQFCASDCAAMDETIEWHEPRRQEDDTAELSTPADSDDTAELKLTTSGVRIYKILGFAALSLLVVLYFVGRAI